MIRCTCEGLTNFFDGVKCLRCRERDDLRTEIESLQKKYITAKREGFIEGIVAASLVISRSILPVPSPPTRKQFTRRQVFAFRKDCANLWIKHILQLGQETSRVDR